MFRLVLWFCRSVIWDTIGNLKEHALGSPPVVLPVISHGISQNALQNQPEHLSLKYEGFWFGNPPYFRDRCSGWFCRRVIWDTRVNLKEHALGSSPGVLPVISHWIPQNALQNQPEHLSLKYGRF